MRVVNCFHIKTRVNFFDDQRFNNLMFSLVGKRSNYQKVFKKSLILGYSALMIGSIVAVNTAWTKSML